jgi:hypothetical protein
MKPDYGALLHSQQVGPNVLLNFYDVEIFEISVTDPPGLTTMLEVSHGGETYAVSFDFTPDAAAHLLARCEESVFARLEDAASATTLRERSVELDPPIRINIEARLGALQQSPREVFAPLLVHRVT